MFIVINFIFTAVQHKLQTDHNGQHGGEEKASGWPKMTAKLSLTACVLRLMDVVEGPVCLSAHTMALQICLLATTKALSIILCMH